MYKYSIKIDLLSESIFSGGESIVSVTDLDILYDEFGIPYYKAKSLKGNLREMVDMIVSNVDDNKLKYKDISQKLFGASYSSKYKDSQEEGILKFSNVSLNQEVSNYLKESVISEEITKNEVINALTDIRYLTTIDRDSKIAKDGSLRTMRVLNKNIEMFCDIFVEQDLSEDELAILLCGVNSLRHLGSLRSRGKGLVKCSLLRDNKQLDDKYKKALVNKVVG